MAIDIKEGDYLVVGAKSYPIRDCEVWDWAYSGRAIRRMLRLTISTSRMQSSGTPSTILTGIRATPLDPVDAETRERLALESPHTLLETFVEAGGTFYRLILEDLKR